MVNQLPKLTNHLANKTKPLRDLLSKKNSWTWSHDKDNPFKDMKECLTAPPVLAFYEMNRKTKVCSDASKYEVTSTNEYIVTLFAYKKECLAFTWLCKPASDYILGKAILEDTYHKQLLKMLTTHCLDQLPLRSHRFRMHLTRFNIGFTLHLPGKKMCTPDTLSRLMPNNIVLTEADQFNEETEAYICSVLDSFQVSVVKLQQIIEEQDIDERFKNCNTFIYAS